VKRVIVNADDFGISTEVNEAVERAHNDGVLRAASLMVAAPATADAVARARRMPRLAVGLHVVLVNGRPALPPERVPDLVDRDGRFPTDLLRAGVTFFFRPGVRRQLEDEIRAQFERFAATGLQLDHVNAQNHMHVHPTVFGLILKVGREFGMRAIRLPREPFVRSYRAGGDRFGARLGNSVLTEPWLALMRVRARRRGVAANDFAFGVNDAGAMNETRVLRLLRDLPDGVTEIFFHLATGPFAGADAGTERYQWAQELSALVSPDVRAAIQQPAVANVTYSEIAGGAAAV
jgi:hopanoid biosynthesis associated protein HpnK